MRNCYKAGLSALLLIAAFFVVIVKIWPCFSGNAGQSYNFQSFDKIYLAGADDAEITVGDDYSVNVQGPSQAIKSLDIQFQHGSLIILHKKNWLSYFNHPKTSAKILITLPELKKIILAGSGLASIKGDIKNPLGVILTGSGRIAAAGQIQGNVNAVLMGSGNIDLPHIHADKLVLNVMGSGRMTLAGECNSSSVNLKGSGDVDIRHLQTKEARLSLRGSGDIEVGSDTDTSLWQISKGGSGRIQLKNN